MFLGVVLAKFSVIIRSVLSMNRFEIFSIEIGPRLEKIITNYNQSIAESTGDQPITLAKVDIDRFEELTATYNIKAVPTGNGVILFDELDRNENSFYLFVYSSISH